MRFLLILGEGDYLILQNEINMLDYIIDQAYEKNDEDCYESVTF